MRNDPAAVRILISERPGGELDVSVTGCLLCTAVFLLFHARRSGWKDPSTGWRAGLRADPSRRKEEKMESHRQ